MPRRTMGGGRATARPAASRWRAPAACRRRPAWTAMTRGCGRRRQWGIRARRSSAPSLAPRTTRRGRAGSTATVRWGTCRRRRRRRLRAERPWPTWSPPPMAAAAVAFPPRRPRGRPARPSLRRRRRRRPPPGRAHGALPPPSTKTPSRRAACTPFVRPSRC
ncbi:hypothetical protein BU14_2840s0001 [Porphyra umbilicalis]|uniref:Uncharacterized protein n=1 Tax=Porphyra umbilicalis TaxID=2786 RepID=A0A1X6NIG8_PORUM|nr:hypothetical protein BU14_2840s0001 [Porphyra umbilicalis]|eukprot:OSX68421.1 hypothetical protein BU14_2840s0001 [Porphyra umbilicalis]